MTRSLSKELISYNPEVKKCLRQLRKDKVFTRKILGQPSTQEHMAKNGDDGVDLVAIEAAQQEVARIAAEVAHRVANETIEDGGV